MSREHKGEERAIGAESSVSIVVYFTRRQIKQFAAELAEPIEPEVASLAFGVLEKNAQDLGMTVICPLATCRGRLCQAPPPARLLQSRSMGPRAFGIHQGRGQLTGRPTA